LHCFEGATIFQDTKNSLRRLYLDDERPWLVGFSGGKDSTMLAPPIFDALLSIPAEERKKPISMPCTDTRVETSAIADTWACAFQKPSPWGGDNYGC